ncbi:MAG: hypothetical protein JWO28_1625 [Hyphomicrobiales bacterium]|jgi:hypothetical protein|nr:hypothetical protein [Hyphomicrobiales bacterium]
MRGLVSSLPFALPRTLRLAFAIAGAAALLPATAFVAQAQGQSCGQLWYQRNAIYAQAGYCFQTARARATFGENCFPPYGRLSPNQQARVNALQYQEDMRGCPR